MLSSEGGTSEKIIRFSSLSPLTDDGVDHRGFSLLSPPDERGGGWPGKLLPDNWRFDCCSVKVHGSLNIRLVAVLGGLNLMIELLVVGRTTKSRSFTLSSAGGGGGGGGSC